MRTKLMIMCLVAAMALVGSVQAAALSSITEEFDYADPAGTWDLPVTPQVSADTGYSWSGNNTGWGLGMIDLYTDGDSELALSIWELSATGSNAWTVFDDGVSGADSVADLTLIDVRGMAGNNDAGGLTYEAIIQDAAGDWFVSDDTALVLASTVTSIDATTTTWRTIAAPVIGTAIVPGAAGTPDLSNVLGGGLNFTAGTSGWLGIEALTFLHGMVPTPSNGAVDVPIAQILSWTANDDPNIVTVIGYDVYLGDEPNVIAGDASVLVSPYGTQGTALTYDPSPDLEFGKTYYWRIDTQADLDYIPGTDPNVLEGRVWSFTAIGANPEISDYDSVVTTSALLPTDLSAVVADGDNDVVGVSWTLLDDDVTYPAGAVASVTDTTSDLYAPTATFTTDTEGTYKVKLTVNDLSGNSAESIAQIDVFDDACTAAGSAPSWAGWNPMDLDFNCVVNVADFAIFALEWLDDISLAVAETYAGAPVHLPFANGIVNGDFEDDGPIDGYGDFVKGWWQSGTPTIVTGANVYEGTYAVELGDIDGLSCLTPNEGFYTLPAGNHSVTFRYKGDLSELVIALGGAMGQDPAPTDGADVALVNSAVAGYETLWVVENATVASYTLYEVRFTVDTEALGSFYIAGSGTGTGYVDDFRIVQNSH